MKVPPPEMDEGPNEAASFRNYAVTFKAVIVGVLYTAARNKKEAAQVFMDDEDKQFDRIERFDNYKIIDVKEIK